MALTNAIIKIRRGTKARFENAKSKLKQGELAIVTDVPEMHFAYEAGKTKKIATEDDISSLSTQKAPYGLVEKIYYTSDTLSLDSCIQDAYSSMADNTIKEIKINIGSAEILDGGNWNISLYRTTKDYGHLIASKYGANSMMLKTRVIHGGTWKAWESWKTLTEINAMSDFINVLSTNSVDEIKTWSPTKWKNAGGTFDLATYGTIFRLVGDYAPERQNDTVAFVDSYFVFISYVGQLYFGFANPADSRRIVKWFDYSKFNSDGTPRKTVSKYYQLLDLTSSESCVDTIYTATSNCIVTVNMLHHYSNVQPTTLSIARFTSEDVMTTDRAINNNLNNSHGTVCGVFRLSDGEKLKMYATANGTGSNNFYGTIVVETL